MDEAQKLPGKPERPAPAPGNPVEQPVGPATNAPPSRTGSDVRSMADNATQKASEAGERVKEKAKEAGNKVKEQGRTFLNEQKERVGSEIETYSAAARRAAERLESESDTNLSSYVSSAADQLDRLATRVQERDLGELIDDVEEIARRRPEVFYGGMFVAGLVAARFLKASKEKRARERCQSAGDGRWERSSYETRRPAGRAFGVSPEPVPVQGATEQSRRGENI
jgi:vacuolar-type H+-ATPase subunit H